MANFHYFFFTQLRLIYHLVVCLLSDAVEIKLNKNIGTMMSDNYVIILVECFYSFTENLL